jgi:hypothetical protein
MASIDVEIQRPRLPYSRGARQSRQADSQSSTGFDNLPHVGKSQTAEKLTCSSTKPVLAYFMLYTEPISGKVRRPSCHGHTSLLGIRFIV